MSRQPDLTKSQLFLDDTWVEAQQRLQRQWYQADIFPEPVLRPEKPWEGTVLILYGTVLKLGATFRMYYVAWNPGQQSYLCVAESDDGLRWHRPVVGEIAYQGSTENNIALTGIVHPSVTHDPDDAETPFKLIWYQDGGIRGATSADGYRWTRLDDPILSPAGDVQNILLHKVDGNYVILAKPHQSGQRYGARVVAVAMSEDFRHFPQLEVVLTPDLIDAPAVEHYGMTAFPYADLYLGLLWRYNGVPDFIDMVLSWSRDLKEWHRPVARDAFIGPTHPWNRLWSSSSSAPPIPVGNQLRFYFGGRSRAHGLGAVQYGAVGVAHITEDRFASLSAGFRQGTLVTKPMTWPGGDLLLNASTTRHLDGHPADGGGTMFVEVVDSDGHPITGFAGDDRAEFAGNAPSRRKVGPAVLRWPGERSLNELAGRRIKLVFALRDSHLYSFRASA